MAAGRSQSRLGPTATGSFFYMRLGASNPATSQVGHLLWELTTSKNLTSAPAPAAITSFERRFAAKLRGGSHPQALSCQLTGLIRSPGA